MTRSLATPPAPSRWPRSGTIPQVLLVCVVPLAFVLLSMSPPAVAQTVSPGPLSKAHADLEGIRNCTRCHEMGQRVIDANRCLACHVPLKARIERKRGYHSSTGIAGKPCESCHHEHAGRDVPLVSWGGPQSSFDHAPTGWPLEGKHRKVPCANCHDPARIRDPEVRSTIERTPDARPFLGIDAACASCHFDEHRGQLSTDCASCHGTDGWSPAPRFDHDRTAYPLRGRHADVACGKCHMSFVDQAYPGIGPARPRAATYMKVKPLEHGSCSACHKDPHEGRLGPGCDACHSVDSWTGTAGGGKAAGFQHERTRFPLRGRHREVPCAGCHPTGGGDSMQLSGIPFAKCADCHEDAHAGQISVPDSLAPGGRPDCSLCHTPDGFAPARFRLEDHARTRYPLEGGHRAVPCVSCHPPDRALQKVGWKRPPRVFRADLTRLAYGSRDPGECDLCHRDPHAGQFARDDATHPRRRCRDCHRVTSFRDLLFDHGRDTSYPLRGKHARIGCGRCHATEETARSPQPDLVPWFPQAVGTLRASRYRGVLSTCEACHSDIHLGQFASGAGTTCDECHTEEAFSPAAKFDHARTRFVLAGAHSTVKCPECHRAVSILPGQSTILYRPLPTACDGCHEDPHGGAYGGTEGGVKGEAEGPLACETCHTTTAWEAVRFDHDRTGFSLGAAHAGVPCSSCHPAGRRDRPSHDCASCHVDPHGGSLGAACGSCHLDGASFRDAGAARFHDRTRLPLLGRHAAIPCESCHADRSSATWTGRDPRCIACHQADYDRTARLGIDHVAWGFPSACETCHDASRWDHASFAPHERCFPIRSGHHDVPCLDCHTSIPSRPTSGCATMTASCTRCHSCEHPSVPGFECRDRKCYECHPSGGGR